MFTRNNPRDKPEKNTCKLGLDKDNRPKQIQEATEREKNGQTKANKGGRGSKARRREKATNGRTTDRRDGLSERENKCRAKP